MLVAGQSTSRRSSIASPKHWSPKIIAESNGWEFKLVKADCEYADLATWGVDNADGFEGFELLKPTDGREQWLVVTRWRDEESFQAWLNSDSFAHGHRSTAERRGQARRHRSPPIARSGLTYPLVDPVPADRRSAQR